MKKIVVLLAILSLVLSSCELASSSPSVSVDNSDNKTTETQSYVDKISELNMEYNNRLQPMKEQYQSDLSSWQSDHLRLESDLNYYKSELSITQSSYDSQINSLTSRAYREAESAGQKAYNETYSRYMNQAAGYGSSMAKPQAEAARRSAYDSVFSSYQYQISSLQSEMSRAVSSVQAKITAQNSLVQSSLRRKELIESTYKSNVDSLISWYNEQKAIIDNQYNQ